jgi:hypothetical protein
MHARLGESWVSAYSTFLYLATVAHQPRRSSFSGLAAFANVASFPPFVCRTRLEGLNSQRRCEMPVEIKRCFM